MTNKELMQMALGALESSRVFVTSREKIKHPEGTEWYDEHIEALRTALAQPEPEPVAVWELQEGGWDTIADADWMETLPIGTLLYTAPPKKEWVGLTDEEMCDIRGRVQEYTPIDAVEYGKVLQLFTAEALEDKNK